MAKIDNCADLETPCFILDVKELERSFKGFHEALASHFKDVVVGYSVKTNSTPHCMQKNLKWGGGTQRWFHMTNMNWLYFAAFVRIK